MRFSQRYRIVRKAISPLLPAVIGRRGAGGDEGLAYRPRNRLQHPFNILYHRLIQEAQDRVPV